MNSKRGIAGAAALTAAAMVGAGAGAAVTGQQATAKAYLVAQMEITDPAGFGVYAKQVPPVLAKHGGRYLARAGTFEQIEGQGPGDRAVILEFPSLEAARAFYHSPEYQAIAPLRHKAATGATFIVEGTAP